MKNAPPRIIRSSPGLFGTTNHYDEHGRLIGYSQPGLFGTTNHYNADGSKAGYSLDNLFGGQNHYHPGGEKAGYTAPGLFADQLFDGHGAHVGATREGLFGTTTRLDRAGLFPDGDTDDGESIWDFDELAD